MQACSSCSAPLRPNNVVCEYCNVRNNIDLQEKWVSLSYDSSERNCPHCKTMMSTLHLNGQTKEDIIEIEQCNQCHGLFFDHGEIERALNTYVKHEVTDQPKLIDNINRDRSKGFRDFSYIDCPVCTKKMNRRNFGFKSGVIVDHCHQHGIWLDSGELIHLMEWKKANGQVLDAQHKSRSIKEKRKQQKKEQSKAAERQRVIMETEKKNSFDFTIFDAVEALLSIIL